MLMDKGRLDEAIEHIEKAANLTKHQNATILSTLSAAYAAKGRFSEAIAAAQKALDIATAGRNNQLADFIRRQLETYKQGKTLK
jgi:tetratricopeptide (TPR) repeat protein